MKSYRALAFYRPAAKTMQAALFAAALGSNGCFSTAYRIDRHLSANPDRPATVVQALRDGDRLVPGMTPREVRLIMGAPARTEAGNATTTAVWHYDQSTRRDDTLRRSAMWALPVPSRTVIFGAGNTVTEIINYDDDHAATPPAVPESVTAPRPLSPPPPSRPVAVTIPAYLPNPDEINVHGWPGLTLQGLTGSGSARNAIINGRVHEPGGVIGEVRLDAVYANGVVLEYRDQRAFLRVGESTDKRTETK